MTMVNAQFETGAERASFGYPASAAFLLKEQRAAINVGFNSATWAERASFGYPASAALLLTEQRA